jgi:protein-S-isoprenylcysteine O-methyltransferase Ste14
MTHKSNILSITLIVAVFCWAWVLTRHEPWTTLRAVGLLLFVVSAVLVFVARLQLGSSFTVAAEARQLVTDGLYSRIRNPIYIFAIPAVAGFILFVEKPWYFLFFVIVIPVQIARARQERKVLRDTFGEAYERYRKQTWF